MSEAKSEEQKAIDKKEVEYVKNLPDNGQTSQDVLDEDGGVEQPSQDPNVDIKSDEGAEG